MPIIGNIGPLELLLVLALALLILGPGKLPEVGAAFGRTIREFRKATTDPVEPASPAAAATPTPAQPVPTVPPVATAPPHADPAETRDSSQSSTSGA